MTTCAEVHDLAAEASLDLLAGDERAAVLGHLDGCDGCRAYVSEFNTVADALLALAPEAEPSPGFEQRVLARLDDGGRVRTRPFRTRPVLIGAAAAAIAVLLIGFAVARTDDPPPATHEVAMHTPAGTNVGSAYLHEGEPAWVVVAVPAWSDEGAEYQLRVTYADGTTSESAGAGTWAAPLDNVDEVRALELVGPDGKVWCSATI